MKCLAIFFCVVALAACQDAPALKPRPIGLVYLVQILSPPQLPNEIPQTDNALPITGDTPSYDNIVLADPPEKVASREKRSAGYGGGGHGGCQSCGGGGGGGYPGGGGGGHGGGGGFGGSGSWSSASASSGSFGGGGGYGKGKYGK